MPNLRCVVVLFLFQASGSGDKIFTVRPESLETEPNTHQKHLKPTASNKMMECCGIGGGMESLADNLDSKQ